MIENPGKKVILAIQHVFAMFGATVLVPALTGLNPSIALIGAGIGTLIFHFSTKRIVPVFLGSSFAFIAAIQMVGGEYKVIDGTESYVPIANKLPYATGGILIAGAVYLIFSLIVKLVGIDIIKKLFPPIVTGPVIMVIGLYLSPVAVSNASQNWILAVISLLTIIIVAIFTRGFFKLVPILIGIIVGYIAAIFMGAVDFSLVTNTVKNSNYFINLSDFMLPKFSLSAILLIAPIAIVTFMEHIGDITTNGAVCGKDFFKNPGLHRTLLGDGLATMFAGLIGAPANTTYSENTGVLAVTKNYNPKILEIAALFAILLGLLRPIGAILQTIPVAVMGGVSLVLFGMIASIGMRTISEANLDFTKSRNLIIVALILVMGLGGVKIEITKNIVLEGISLAALVGIIANLLLHIVFPDNPEND